MKKRETQYKYLQQREHNAGSQLHRCWRSWEDKEMTFKITQSLQQEATSTPKWEWQMRGACVTGAQGLRSPTKAGAAAGSIAHGGEAGRQAVSLFSNSLTFLLHCLWPNLAGIQETPEAGEHSLQGSGILWSEQRRNSLTVNRHSHVLTLKYPELGP